MKKSILLSLVLLLGVAVGTGMSPLFAQSEQESAPQTTCFSGEGASAACSGKWIFFAGNTATLDESAWVLRINAETGQIWYKNGKKLVMLNE